MGKSAQDIAAGTSEVPVERKQTGRFRFEHIAPAFVVFAGMFGSIMYFTGVQYLDARAEWFGLVSDLHNSSFQETVAIGSKLWLDEARAEAFFAEIAIAIGIWLALGWAGNFGFSLKRQMQAFNEVSAELRRLRGELSGGEGALSAEERGMEVRILQSQLRNTQRIRTRVLGTALIIATCKAIAFFFTCSLAISFFFEMTHVGREEGGSAAQKILDDVKGGCSYCREFRSGDRAAIGVPVLQSDSMLVVSTAEGLEIFQFDEPLTITRDFDWEAWNFERLTKEQRAIAENLRRQCEAYPETCSDDESKTTN